MKSNKTLLTIIITVLIAGGGLYLISRQPAGEEGPTEPGQYDQFAQCLTDKGAKFYGAYWCPHCQQQKKWFGGAMKNVTYVECAVPGDTSAQTQACTDADITGYPTWVFPDGSRVSGEQPLKDLAAKSGCQYSGT